MKKPLRQAVFAAAGYNTTFFGSGRKEFKPGKGMPSFETYLKETAEGTRNLLPNFHVDEGIISNFMAPRFLHQGNLPGFLPFMLPELAGKPCSAVEGACGSGGRALFTGMKSILAELADCVFVSGFEVQNVVKAVYGADILAGAAYYKGERKKGSAFFFPGIFAERAGAYFKKYGEESARHGMAKWYELSILNARKNPKAQEYHNQSESLLSQGMTPPNAKRFVPNLNLYDCSKVSDGASSVMLLSEEGLKRCGISRDNAIEIIALSAVEGDITQGPDDLTQLSQTKRAIDEALEQACLSIQDIGLLEVHDCFSITGLLTLEACGLALAGEAAGFVLDGNTTISGKIPTNLSGGLGGFGHPTGATGVRQIVDLLEQFTGKAPNQAQVKKEHGMLISMGGNDKTVTVIIVKK
jgi:acetyl-CoA C-acetyltransferase